MNSVVLTDVSSIIINSLTYRAVDRHGAAVTVQSSFGMHGQPLQCRAVDRHGAAITVQSSFDMHGSAVTVQSS